MKINPVHYNFIKQEIRSIGIEKIKEHKAFLLSPENPRPPKDLNKRLRWDLLYMVISSQYICNTLYLYINDDHIDTALKQIMKEYFSEI